MPKLFSKSYSNYDVLIVASLFKKIIYCSSMGFFFKIWTFYNVGTYLKEIKSIKVVICVQKVQCLRQHRGNWTNASCLSKKSWGRLSLHIYTRKLPFKGRLQPIKKKKKKKKKNTQILGKKIISSKVVLLFHSSLWAFGKFLCQKPSPCRTLWRICL